MQRDIALAGLLAKGGPLIIQGTHGHAHCRAVGRPRISATSTDSQRSVAAGRPTNQLAGGATVINSVDSQLGVLLRQTQWLLDDAAHDIPAGRYHPGKRDELAVVLEHVAGLIRATTSIIIAPRGTPNPIIEQAYPALGELPKQRATTSYPGRPSTVSEEP